MMMKRAPYAVANEGHEASESEASVSKGPLKKKVKREMDALNLLHLAQESTTDNTSVSSRESDANADTEERQDAATKIVSSSSPSDQLAASSDNNAADDDSEASIDKQLATAPPVAITAPFSYLQRGAGRIRLPDKLMEYLNKKVLPDTLWWQPDGNGFAFNVDQIQSTFLDKHFRGTKLSSFIRSLNRWGFRRIFYHSLPKNALSFHHPLFKKDDPNLMREMKMITYTSKDKKDKKDNAKSSPPASPPASPIATRSQSPSVSTGSPQRDNTAARPVQVGSQAIAQVQAPAMVPSYAPAPFAEPQVAPLAIANDPLQTALQSLLGVSLPDTARQSILLAAAQQQQQNTEQLVLQGLLQQLSSQEQQQQQQPVPALALNPVILSTITGVPAGQPQQPPASQIPSTLAPASPADQLQSLLAQALQPQQAPSAANPLQQLFQEALAQQQQQQQRQLALLRMLAATQQSGNALAPPRPQEEEKSAGGS